MTSEKKKYLRVMADYDSSGLWDNKGLEVIPEDIPEIPFWFIPKLKAWANEYEDNDSYLEDSENDFPLKEFSEKGLELAQKLAKVMPDWEIWYYDEHKMVQSLDENEKFTNTNDLLDSMVDRSGYFFRVEV